MREEEEAEFEFVHPGEAQFQPFSSARIRTEGPHNKIRIWNRGAYAGELTLARGDGGELMRRLGLKPSVDTCLLVKVKVESRQK